MIQVGKPTKFTAPAYFNGKFVNVSLEEFGKWVVLFSIRISPLSATEFQQLLNDQL